MYINITQKETTLDYPIDNSDDSKLIAIREMFYRVKWFNISESKGNNWIKKFIDNRIDSILTLHDGYYGFCELKEELKDKYDINLSLSNANLKVTLSFKPTKNTYYIFAKKLATILGFENNRFDITADNYIFESENSLDLEVNSPLYVCLDELSTTKNLWNGKPSNILRVIPSSNNAAYCQLEIKSFESPQFKKLTNRLIDKISIRITDKNGNEVECDGLFIVLEVR